MKKVVLLIVLTLNTIVSFAQKNQKIAFIDMEYILENIPEYLKAQNTLDDKVAKWKIKLEKQARLIEILKSDLANEKEILTKDLIEEREEEITLKQEQTRRLESLYFGPNGDMFNIRQKLVKPVQDQVYNAIQKIVAQKKYDFVFDKSSDLVMLYSNKKYDISELILAYINKTRKIDTKNTEKEEKVRTQLTEKQNKLLATKTAAKEEKITAINKKKAAKRKLVEEKRKIQLAKREEKRRLLKEKKEALRKKREQK